MPPFIPPFDIHEHLVRPWLIGTDAWSQSAQADTVWTVLMGALVAIACGWIGCFLILQGMALVGDAISHTVLLGIVVTFLLTGQVTGLAMVLGATVTGVVTTILIERLHSSSRLKEDAAIGVVFTSLFALGVVLLSTLASRAHIDTQHVLYGNLEFVASSEKIAIAGTHLPLAVFQMALVGLALCGLITAFYKQLLVVSFDPQLAASLGMRPRLVRYAMMAVLSIVVVGAFSSVGAILVVAMLIAPAATAYLLTNRLPVMLALSSVAGVIAALVGYHVAYWLEVSAAGSMVCTAGGLFGLTFLMSPSQGLVATAARRLRVRLRTGSENVVRHLLRAPGLAVPRGDRAAVARALGISSSQFWLVTRSLLRRGLIEPGPARSESFRLTPRGLAEAERLDRAHRLWESYLVAQVGLASDHVHPTAHELEHVSSEQLIERLDDALGHPETDPHGAPIPRSSVSDRFPGIFTLSKLRIGDTGRIVGVADATSPLSGPSPSGGPSATAGIARLGLTLGQSFTVTGRDTASQKWTIQLEGGDSRDIPHSLADVVLVQLELPPPARSDNRQKTTGN